MSRRSSRRLSRQSIKREYQSRSRAYELSISGLSSRLASPEQAEFKRKFLIKNGLSTYVDYIQSVQWKRFRKQYIAMLTSTVCRLHGCSNQGRILHHITYERIGYELFKDIAFVCAHCHEKIHDNVRMLSRRRKSKRSLLPTTWGGVLSPGSTSRVYPLTADCFESNPNKHYLPWGGAFLRHSGTVQTPEMREGNLQVNLGTNTPKGQWNISL